jgi:hypothetical protein
MTVTARSEARAAQERLLEARSRMAYLLNLTQLEYNAMLRRVFQLIEAGLWSHPTARRSPGASKTDARPSTSSRSRSCVNSRPR